jgi:catechol 2,3-dioxygenase-like lactoylglutathione lyase family enzyme
MLGSARLQTLVWSSDLARARPFYSDLLGLRFKAEAQGALVYEVGGGDLRVSPTPSTKPSEHTVLGFAVSNIDDIAEAMAARGLQTERFPGFDHDDRGIWRAPDGTKVLWFRDPDGNLLSVVQYG